MELKILDFEKSVEKFPVLKKGCIIDTNVLFAGSYPLDVHHRVLISESLVLNSRSGVGKLLDFIDPF